MLEIKYGIMFVIKVYVGLSLKLSLRMATDKHVEL